MKKLKKILTLIMLFAIVFAQIPIVKAAGNGSIGFGGGTVNATVGKEVEVTLALTNLTDVPGGVSGVQGSLNYDSTFLKFVSSESLAPFGVSYADVSKKFIGFAVGNNITTASSNLIKFKFEALKTGSTKVNVHTYKAVDGKSANLTLTDTNKTINISEPVVLSDNANLSSLGVAGYTLSPAFNKDTLEYNVTVPYSVTSATITATPEDSNAKVANTGSKNLTAGQKNTFTVTCTAQNGKVSKAYKVNITREKAPDVPKSTDNTLKGLSVSGYDITPAFNKDVLEYNLTVPNDATNISVKALTNDGKATVEVKGNNNLKVGNNKVEVIVTAEDKSTRVYTINVTKEDKKEDNPQLDSDATLSRLYIGGFTLSPAFNKNTNVYSINVGSSVGGLNVDAVPTSSKAKVEVKGNNGWNYGMNTVSIVVTAENGNKNTYIVNVNRKDPNSNSSTNNKSNDSYLSDLIINDGTLTPNFNKDISSYDIVIPYDVEKLNIKYSTSNGKAKVEVIGNDELKVGTNNIQIKVTAEDGSIRIYTINAKRSALSAKNNLKVLSANGFMLNPSFDKDRLEYDLKVKSNTDYLDLTAIPEDDESKIEISGNSDFKVGNNVVLVKVTDKNGFAKYYKINVNKPEFSILGMSLGQFLMFLLLGLGLIGIILLLIFKRKKDNKNTPAPAPSAPTPVIDFKPEFNFGSRNGTDDDVVYPGGVLNQGNGALPNNEETKKVLEADYQDLTDKDIEDVTRNFDFFDETITKDELIAAIREGIETHNPEKLKMLLKQEELNRLKKEIKRKEEEKRNRSGRHGY